jgi:hypothetical protein
LRASGICERDFFPDLKGISLIVVGVFIDFERTAGRDVDFNGDTEMFIFPKDDTLPVINVTLVEDVNDISTSITSSLVCNYCRYPLFFLSISLLYQRNINIPVGPMGIISSIIKLSDRKILVVESSYKKGHLFVFNNVGKFIREMKIKGGPWDVTQLDEGTIAVTYPEENSLKCINLVTDQGIDTIPLNTSGWGWVVIVTPYKLV